MLRFGVLNILIVIGIHFPKKWFFHSYEIQSKAIDPLILSTTKIKHILEKICQIIFPSRQIWIQSVTSLIALNWNPIHSSPQIGIPWCYSALSLSLSPTGHPMIKINKTKHTLNNRGPFPLRWLRSTRRENKEFETNIRWKIAHKTKALSALYGSFHIIIISESLSSKPTSRVASLSSETPLYCAAAV